MIERQKRARLSLGTAPKQQGIPGVNKSSPTWARASLLSQTKAHPNKLLTSQGAGHPPPSPKVVDKNRLSALGVGPSGTSGSPERAPPRAPSPTSPPALLPSMTPSPTMPKRGAGMAAGVLHDSSGGREAMRLWRRALPGAWNGGKIGEKDLPEVVAIDSGALREVASGARAVRVNAARRLPPRLRPLSQPQP